METSEKILTISQDMLPAARRMIEEGTVSQVRVDLRAPAGRSEIVECATPERVGSFKYQYNVV